MRIKKLKTPESTSKRILQILSGSRVFQAAPLADLERLTPHCRYEQHRRGSKLFRFGDDGSSLVVVGRGRLKGLVSSDDGEQKLIIGLFYPGDIFGELSVIDNKPRPGAAIPIADTDVVYVPRAEMLALVERRPAVALRVVESLSNKLRLAFEFGVNLRFYDIATRMHRRLVSLRAIDGTDQSDGSVRIQHGLSQEEIASSIGASREALNKLLAEWKTAGVIETGRGYILVRDFDALRRLLPPASRPHAQSATDGSRASLQIRRPVS